MLTRNGVNPLPRLVISIREPPAGVNCIHFTIRFWVSGYYDPMFTSVVSVTDSCGGFIRKTVALGCDTDCNDASRYARLSKPRHADRPYSGAKFSDHRLEAGLLYMK